MSWPKPSGATSERPVVWVALCQSLRFLKPVFPGDTVTAKLEVTAIDAEKRFITCSTECLNQDGDSVLTGEATVLLDELR